jgi:hypothetical protein
LEWKKTGGIEMKEIINIFMVALSIICDAVFIASLITASVMIFVNIDSAIFIIAVKSMIVSIIWILSIIYFVNTYEWS